MKIIQKGDLELANVRRAQPTKFTCSLCGCIWEATKDEYHRFYSPLENYGWIECQCPTCGNLIRKEG